MMEEYQLRVLPQVAYKEESIKQYLAKEKGLDVRTLQHIRVLKKSVDARQRTIFVNLKVRAYINELPQDDEYVHTDYPDVRNGKPVIVVGAGPGGLFAALRLIEQGLRPIVIERGKNVRERKKDLSLITKTQKVDGESNYCFGEGGAGAYSDGKLYTRSKKRGSVDKILNVFCQHGASTSILADAHPHIGTDKLPRVIENMRNTILECGGEVHFQTKMVRLILQGDKAVGVEAVSVGEADGLPSAPQEREFRGPVILATGHSARDVYRYLAEAKIEMEPKGIAVGVRLEHPSLLIDQIQYHNRQGRGQYLPAAEYSFVEQVDGRGVYSFCMCPGGFVIPAATGPQQIVVNGMSPSNRGTAWSNSGMVVEVRPEDMDDPSLTGENGSDEVATQNDALRLMRFQERMERDCWQQGNMRQTAPAQRMADFVNNRLSYDLPKSSYAPGLISSPLHFWLPAFISRRLQEGFKAFGRRSHGFLTDEAVLIAIETRTSSPVRIVRDAGLLQHLRVAGLFPCGEGAGYAGGIVSAGIDGERCADSCAAYLNAL
ncbi:MAG: FAD-binding protein [Prevotella buccae]|uniref:NAD(P)/FAD-dependent oxidoreductase n=1 Tax=Segatella buccae TaxID=28126 RepID=UPI0001C414B2|nr:FAD-binding protein [Segatella buccae]EFC75827.1 pyridine nucleotide-disulfide oxidoreductase family protein [Segatella buccae D17]MBS5895229.1 FAD-binding protein [Segatella buccae]